MKSVKEIEFDPKQYWRNLVNGDFALNRVGNVGCGVEFNEWIYRWKFETLLRVLKMHVSDLEDKRLFEAAFGVGYYLNKWNELGLHSVSGVDLSETAVAHAARQFPNFNLQCVDLADPLGDAQTQDVVIAIDVLYHILDDQHWEQSVQNLCNLVKPGGVLLITDQPWPFRYNVTQHVRRRTLNDYQIIFDQTGFLTIERHLFTRWLGHEKRPDTRFSLSTWTWKQAHRLNVLAKKLHIAVPIGKITGMLLTKLERSTPVPPEEYSSLELMIIKRED